MKQVSILFLSLLYFLVLASGCTYAQANSVSDKEEYSLVQKVNPFVGTAAHGHTYPGVTLPFGMVQLSPDTGNTDWDWCSGYHYTDSSVMGFSHTHLSGTGCSDYGDFLFMPTTGPLKFQPGSKKNPDKGYRSRFSHDQEKAMPGFYGVYLKDYKIDVQLTATKRVGVHRYTYPADKTGNIIIDLPHGLGGNRVRESKLEIVTDREIRGYVRKTGWSPDRFLYFVARFSRPFEKSGLVINDKLKKSKKKAAGKNLKCYAQFDTSKDREVLVKVALSAVSWEGAARNMDAECPGWDFQKLCNSAKESWQKQLSKITVQGGSAAEQTTFYTALYHTSLAPNLFMDVDGRYRGMDKEIHTADNFENYTVFSLWDTFRAEHPLFTIIEQERTNDFINAMLGKYEQSGLLPYWELASGETWCMIGYHAIPVIADAWVKNIRGFDADKAIEAMKKSAMQDHQGLRHYKKLGFVPMNKESNSVSRTLEYAYDDWCIAAMAKQLGLKDDYEEFIRRSQFYKNVIDPSVGFARGRKSDGSWKPNFDPDQSSGLGAGEFTEGNSWHYTWFAPHDVPGLINLLGGEQKFIDKLDELFTRQGHEHMDVSGLIGQYAHGNEPCHNYAYLYTYAGAYWKTQEKVAQIVRTLYSDQPDGLCGNEDCGQMSAWYVFNAMGFYPACPGLPIYVFGTPLFPEVSINLENGNKFNIIADDVSDKNIYIQSVTLNGQPYNKAYIQHTDIINGGTLVFKMGPQPNKDWAQDKADRPYSEPGKPVLPMPSMIEAPLSFLDETTVALQCDDDSATIVYTLDGRDPDSKSKSYTKPFVVNETTTLKARACKEGFLPSGVLAVALSKMIHKPACRVDPVEPGLNFSYYEGNYQETAAFADSKPVDEGRCENFDISVAKRGDEFGLQFTGYFKAPEEGVYQFWTKSDDGSRLFIDSELIVDNDGVHGAVFAKGPVALKAGYHEIKVLYFENQAAEMLEVSVTSPGGQRELIKGNFLYRTK